ncbi:hypothetical protein AX774_g4376 [Zancudomyces culisetae]|uniref:Uncharacterized protein n=1 Tax=Zancudomyces culisetae TaxID=1213189 RepID=A0A1R1PMG6_ZANCU|nr:hypothetical protein AX774_g4376 [Zancudomyces culisetae]|eukprot:OMH82154.1 hypothetical protein AX774_g4376 [Zancudomyces culisetae]
MLRDTLEEKYMWLIAYSVVANDRDVHGEQQYDSEAQEILRVKNSVYELQQEDPVAGGNIKDAACSDGDSGMDKQCCGGSGADAAAGGGRAGVPPSSTAANGVWSADLYKMVVQLMINLAGMGYSLQTTRFFYGLVLGQSIDISLVVFYISRVVRTIVTPYPAELVNLLLKIIVRILSPLLESCTINSDLDINNNMDVDANTDTSNTENGGTDADGENTYFYLLRFLKNIKSAYYNRNGQPTLSPNPKNETNERVLVADIEKLDMGAIEASGLIIRIMNQL